MPTAHIRAHFFSIMLVPCYGVTPRNLRANVRCEAWLWLSNASVRSLPSGLRAAGVRHNVASQQTPMAPISEIGRQSDRIPDYETHQCPLGQADQQVEAT